MFFDFFFFFQIHLWACRYVQLCVIVDVRLYDALYCAKHTSRKEPSGRGYGQSPWPSNPAKYQRLMFAGTFEGATHQGEN